MTNTFDPVVVEKLKERFSGVHPLMFFRSLNKAKTQGDLWEILDKAQNERYPLEWDNANHCWKHTEDALKADSFFKE